MKQKVKKLITQEDKISKQFPERIYAGFTNITNQSKQQLINEVLNKLHLAINNDRNIQDWQVSAINSFVRSYAIW